MRLKLWSGQVAVPWAPAAAMLAGTGHLTLAGAYSPLTARLMPSSLQASAADSGCTAGRASCTTVAPPAAQCKQSGGALDLHQLAAPWGAA